MNELTKTLLELYRTVTENPTVTVQEIKNDFINYYDNKEDEYLKILFPEDYIEIKNILQY